MQEIIFVTHNKGKIASAQKHFKKLSFKIFEYDLEEPRSDDVEYISKIKVMEAYELVKKPCISLDAGFFIDALNGFQRAFVNFALETINIEGILKLMENKENRKCRFKECLSFYDGKELKQFVSHHEGTLSFEMLGIDSDKKWSDLWYIFIPNGFSKTLAQMTDEERATRDKVTNEVNSMKLFADWYIKEKNN